MPIIVINSVPVPWAAHQGYGKRAYNPKANEKKQYQWQIRSQWNQRDPLSGPISLDLAYHMPIPCNTSKTRRLQMLNDKIHHIVRPDATNLQKFVEDCLKGIVFEDDSQVVKITSRKIYGEIPKTIVIVENLND